MKKVREEYQQEIHQGDLVESANCTERASFKIRVASAGAGEFLVLNVTEWSIETDQQIDQIAEAIKKMLKECQE